MQSIRKVTEDILWVGCNDRRITLFERICSQFLRAYLIILICS